MPVSKITPSGEGLSEEEIRKFRRSISRAVVRLKCRIHDDKKGVRDIYSTGFVYNAKGHVLSSAGGFPKGHFRDKMAYLGEKFQKVKVVLDYDLDSALVIPKEKRLKKTNYLKPTFELPPVGKWLFTVAHTGRLSYTFYEGKASSLPRTVCELRKEFRLTNFPNTFQFIQVGGMDLWDGAIGAPITDNTGRVLGIYSFNENNLDFVIPSTFIRHLNPNFVEVKEEMDKEMTENTLEVGFDPDWRQKMKGDMDEEMLEDIPEGLRSRSNAENVNSKESAAGYRVSSSMVDMRDRFRSATTAGQRDDTQHMQRPSKGNFDVSSGIAEEETPTESSRTKQKCQEIVKKPPPQDFGRVDDSDGSVGIQNAVSGNLVPFDHSRVQRGIEQAFDRVRSVMEAYSGERKTSSREKQKRWEIVKEPTHEDLGRVEIDPFDDSDDTVAIHNAVSGNLVPFDHSRVQRGIEQAFKKLRC